MKEITQGCVSQKVYQTERRRYEYEPDDLRSEGKGSRWSGGGGGRLGITANANLNMLAEVFIAQSSVVGTPTQRDTTGAMLMSSFRTRFAKVCKTHPGGKLKSLTALSRWTVHSRPYAELRKLRLVLLLKDAGLGQRRVEGINAEPEDSPGYLTQAAGLEARVAVGPRFPATESERPHLHHRAPRLHI